MPKSVEVPSTTKAEGVDSSTTKDAIILIVDDEISHLESLKLLFERAHLQSKTGPEYRFRVHTASSGPLALEIIRKYPIDIILTDLMMPQMTGRDLLKATRALGMDADVIVMTAFGTVENAVEAMRDGAYDFIQKPFKSALVMRVVERCIERRLLKAENLLLRKTIVELEPSNVRDKPIVGRSPAMLEMMETVRQAADSTASVLIYGESGTGKELIARALHEFSPRMDKALVTLNCAALPESILEAELFGYEKGAFTGANEKKLGRIDRANGGTLFLDEIGELSAQVQVKLLRVLQEGEFDRVGGTEPIKVDFRLVVATNRNLETMIEDGLFREDLYYRLNVIAVHVPPMRERPEDIPLLVDHFIRRYSRKNKRAITGASDEALKAFQEYDWPGNVREIENVIERAVVLTRNTTIQVDDLPKPLLRKSDDVPCSIRRDGENVMIPIGSKLADVEQAMIHETLKKTGGDKSLAAQLLGIAARTIYRKLEMQRDE
jgi:two-component system, NtrC family, response regulator HydG